MFAELLRAKLQKGGVKHVSTAVALYSRVMGDLRKAARPLADGDWLRPPSAPRFGEIMTMVSEAAGRGAR
jgi:hypothetical protein